jgi:hypothetical protein
VLQNLNYKFEDLFWNLRPGYMLNNRGNVIQFPAGTRDFSFLCKATMAQRLTQPQIRWVPWAVSSDLKRPARESDLIVHLCVTSRLMLVKRYIHLPIRRHTGALN